MKPINEQIILITGSTDGIGKLTALHLARQHAHVLIHGRNKEKVAGVVDELKKTSKNNKIEGYVADFSSLNEVRRLTEVILSRYPSLDVLVNNAAVAVSMPRLSEDGYELQFAINYLAPFLFTSLLLPALRNAAPSRIVNVSSVGQREVDFDNIMLERDFEDAKAYRQSKLALIMFTFDLAEQLKDENITVNSLHPGTYLNTNMVRNLNITPLGEPESGAEAVTYLSVSENVAGITGKYFNVKTEAMANSQAYDMKARKRLRDLSIEFTGLK
ncbi:MAG TPA: SDR family oxidoreductase [Ignavibacteriaceae bacterium]|nr:SDR family oxidoreductase [Ignavibacteriaceae bacterium]